MKMHVDKNFELLNLLKPIVLMKSKKENICGKNIKMDIIKNMEQEHEIITVGSRVARNMK